MNELWQRMSPEERQAHILGMYAASLIAELDMRDFDDDDDEEEDFVPASKKAILNLHVPTWGETIQKRCHGLESCDVCREDLEMGQQFRMTPCGHYFHQTCIFEWLHVDRRCPGCRFALPSEEEQRLLDEEEARAKDGDDEGEDQFVTID
ncbi:hypothetical protein EJB05_02222, partial [Eragrostis curvula]